MKHYENYDEQAQTIEGSEQAAQSHKQVRPAATFPNQYVLGTFITLQDAQQAADALRGAGFTDHEMHILEGPDFVEAISHDHSPLNIISSTIHDTYLPEVTRGRSFLAIRPASIEQLPQIRDLLLPHGAYLVKYVDAWSQRELIP